MKAVTGHDKVCADICEALGLKHCRKLDLHMARNEIVTVTVEYYPEIDGVKQLIPILKKFELVEKMEEKKKTIL